MAHVWTRYGVVIVASVLALPGAAALAWTLATARMRRGAPAGRAWWASVAEVGTVLGTAPWLVMTAWPQPAPGAALNLVPLRDLGSLAPREVLAQVGGNLLVFAAAGFFLPVRFVALAAGWRIAVLAATGAVAIETMQYLLALGRVSSIDDVLLNTLGAWLAALASRPWWAAGAPPGRAAPARSGSAVPSARACGGEVRGGQE